MCSSLFRGRYVALRALFPLVAASMATSACAGESGPPPAGPVDTPVQALPQAETAAVPPVTAASVPSALLDQLRDDVAAQTGTSRAAVRVTSSEAVTWADSALGCGNASESALQVLTPGYRVVLEVQGRQFAYHSDRRGNFRRCPLGQSAPPVTGGPQPVDR